MPWVSLSGIFANHIFVSDGILICERLLKNGSQTYFSRWCFSKVAKISDIMFFLAWFEYVSVGYSV